MKVRSGQKNFCRRSSRKKNITPPPKTPKFSFFSKFFAKKNQLPAAAPISNRLVPSNTENQANKRPAGLVDVNLIPEGTYLLSSRTIFVHLLTGSLIAGGLIFFAYVGLVFYGNYVNKQDQKLTEQIEVVKGEIESYHDLQRQVEIWDKKVTVVENLFNKHIFWTELLNKLEGVVSPEVYFTNISASIYGSVNLSAIATSYNAVAKQYVAFLQHPDIFTKVEVGSLTGDSDSGEISFAIILQINPQVFYSTLTSN